MRRIGHDALRFGSFPGKASEVAIEHAHEAPADEAIVERLVRAVAGWRVLPLKPVADHVDDATHHPPVIHPRNTVRKREERDIRAIWRSLSRNRSPITASVWKP